VGLAHRIIPTILCRGRQQVKGEKFDSWRSVGLAAQAVRVHQARGVDEVCLLDVGATLEERGPDLSLVEELADVLFAPLSVGGGVRGIEDARALLMAGADKVVVGTGGPRVVAEIAGVVGSQAVVASIDISNGWVRTHCGRVETRQYAVDRARACAESGAGEILLTSIEREGTMQGYDIKLVQDVARAVHIPVIAHGGCSGYSDMVDAIHAGASAVAAGALFQFTDCTPKAAARALHGYGIEVRL
jgi:cyclase